MALNKDAPCLCIQLWLCTYSRDPNKSSALIRALPGKNAKILTRALPLIRALPEKNQILPVKIFYRQKKGQNKTFLSQNNNAWVKIFTENIIYFFTTQVIKSYSWFLNKHAGKFSSTVLLMNPHFDFGSDLLCYLNLG